MMLVVVAIPNVGARLFGVVIWEDFECLGCLFLSRGG